MTKVVRGAGRAKAAAQKKKHDQKDPVVGGNRDAALKKAAKPPAKKAAAKKSAPASTAGDWDSEATLGANVDRLKTAGVTWRGIQELASANGHDIPWPDGGKLLRARKQFLAGTEGQPTQRRSRKATTTKSANGEPLPEGLSVQERIELAIKNRNVPWEDGDYSDEELLAFLVGRQITYISRNSGKEYTSRIPKESQHNKIRHGKDGPYVDFASMEGPFEAISLSRIINVS